jgi:arsenate reductase
MIEAAGYAPTVVEYRKAGWTCAKPDELLTTMAARPCDILREKGTPAAERGLLTPDATDDGIPDAMVAHPLLVNRPIVVTPKGARRCRSSEMVLGLLKRSCRVVREGPTIGISCTVR